MAVLEADGIDGSTLLGFLAAVGSLRLLAERYAAARLWFDRRNDRARLGVPEATTPDDLIGAILERYWSSERQDELAALRNADKPGDIPSERVLELAEETRSNCGLGAFVSGLICDGLTRTMDADKAVETTLCAANGSGWQSMFVTMRDLLSFTEAESGGLVRADTLLVTDDHLRTSLTEPWTFRDEVPQPAQGSKGWMGSRKPTLRWDEGAERLYALRLHKPTDDPEPFRTQLGGYALAAASLPCFLVVPTRRGGQTIFTQRASSTEIDFFWPLWDRPASLAMISALQTSAEPLCDAASARRRGVYRLFRARRMSLEKGKLVFAPAEAVW